MILKLGLPVRNCMWIIIFSDMLWGTGAVMKTGQSSIIFTVAPCILILSSSYFIRRVHN